MNRSRIVALVGPRQSGKTTLARQFVQPNSLNYFDLEDPVSLARLEQPLTTRARIECGCCRERGERDPLLDVVPFRSHSKARVDVQWTRTRFALVHNIGKIHTLGALH